MHRGRERMKKSLLTKLLVVFGGCSVVVVALAFGLLFVGINFRSAPGFVDVDALPPSFMGEEHRVFADGDRLIVEVEQTPGLNVVHLEAFERDGALYIRPRQISSGGPGRRQLEVDVARFGLGSDWHRNVYWVVQEVYPSPFRAVFRPQEEPPPWHRMRMNVEVR